MGLTYIAKYNQETGDRYGIEPGDMDFKAWDDFAAIKAWQKAMQLSPDSWFGRNSARAHLLAEMMYREGLRVDRSSFVATQARTRNMPKDPISIVWHDSVTRSAADTHRVLEKKRLSVHFMIPENEPGVIYQCADPGAYWTIHAGAFNQESIGIDLVTLITPTLLSKLRPADRERAKRILHAPWAATGDHSYIDHTESQKEDLVRLARVLHAFFEIPKIAPDAMTGYGTKIAGISDVTYHGSIAHAQFATNRWDGLRTLEVLRDAKVITSP